MSTPDEGIDSAKRASPYVYFGSLYLVAVGLLYLWGYWPTFGINILQYLNLTDILKLAAYPLVSSFIFVAVGAVFGELTGPHHLLPSGGGRDTPIGRLLQRHAPLIRVGYTLITVTLLLFGPITKWLVLSVLFAIPVYLEAKKAGLFASVLPSDSTRSIVILLLAVLPTFAYGRGKLDAAAILDGTSYQYLAAGTVEGLTVPDPTDIRNRVKYLGQVNDYVFFLLPDNVTTVVVRFDKTHGLQLRRFRRPTTP